MKCAPCSEKQCTSGKDCTDIKAEVSAKYVGEDLKILMTADTLTENFYMQKTRILFTKYSNAPVTTLVVKDRVLAHNPIGAIYSGFYRKKRFNLEK